MENIMNVTYRALKHVDTMDEKGTGNRVIIIIIINGGIIVSVISIS